MTDSIPIAKDLQSDKNWRLNIGCDIFVLSGLSLWAFGILQLRCLPSWERNTTNGSDTLKYLLSAVSLHKKI